MIHEVYSREWNDMCRDRNQERIQTRKRPENDQLGISDGEKLAITSGSSRGLGEEGSSSFSSLFSSATPFSIEEEQELEESSELGVAMESVDSMTALMIWQDDGSYLWRE